MHKHHTVVVAVKRNRCVGWWTQMQDVCLQLVQHTWRETFVLAVLLRVDEHGHPLVGRRVFIGGFKLVDGMQVITPLFAPRGQQRVTALRQVFTQVPPMFLAWVVHKHQHRQMSAQRHQGLHGLHGQRSDPKHHQARRQTREAARCVLVQCVEKCLVHISARFKMPRPWGVLLHILQQVSPHGGLPRMWGR